MDEGDRSQVLAALGKALDALERYEQEAAPGPAAASNKVGRTLRPYKH
jgi:hypothetical protein